ACVAVCGWHYARIWFCSGSPFPADWGAGARLWQDPGFRTSTFYFQFGEALGQPLFCAFHSFNDGVYSTLWGDGLISGQVAVASRPPCNYDLMMAGYWLAVVLSVLSVIGLLAMLIRFIQRPSPEFFAILSLIFGFGLALACLSLLAPTQAVVKAFYAFP